MPKRTHEDGRSIRRRSDASVDEPVGKMTPAVALWALRALGCRELLALEMASMFEATPSTAVVTGWSDLDPDLRSAVETWVTRCGFSIRVLRREGDRVSLCLERRPA
ncbi:MAG: hypothetical protein DMD79_05085 [Candidatus Rokuibacteriota bacterium]|nr:MAG: hypothetical protein DMD79_05085 [Candidatus Rokubacteria bacterium]